MHPRSPTLRSINYLSVDMALIAIATASAVLLRDDLDIAKLNPSNLAPYLAVSLGIGLVCFLVLGTHRVIWRLSTLQDLVVVVAAAMLTVALTVATSFAVNRLEGIARAVPILQMLLLVSLMVGMRIAARLRHVRREQPRQLQAQVVVLGRETVLLVGVSRLTEAYMRAVAEFASQRVRIAGLLGRYGQDVGRFIGQRPILGTPEDLTSVLRNLDEHGVGIERIIVTTSYSRLSEEARIQLAEIEAAGAIKVSFIAEMMGLEEPHAVTAGRPTADAGHDQIGFTFAAHQLEALSGRHYWGVKRAFDFLAALVLMILLSPVLLVCTLLVALDVGRPVTFWQQRPGLGGAPFRIYKLRTMRPRHDADGQSLDDSARVSFIGAFLRRTRLDELPQLYNILVGDMSFVGPRPLLPSDQSEAHRARLLVRPGLTGWAQVMGGRAISAADKAALDVWYVLNASLRLDVLVAARTIPLVLFGERISHAAIQRAWGELRTAGICQTPDRDEATQELRRTA